MLSINLLSGSFLSICMIFLSIPDILLLDRDNESVIDLMLSINLFSSSLLLMSDKSLTSFDNESTNPA